MLEGGGGIEYNFQISIRFVLPSWKISFWLNNITYYNVSEQNLSKVERNYKKSKCLCKKYSTPNEMFLLYIAISVLFFQFQKQNFSFYDRTFIYEHRILKLWSALCIFVWEKQISNFLHIFFCTTRKF